MANYDDMLSYIQHSHSSSMFVKNGKYDLFSDNQMLVKCKENLWYRFNEDSWQLPYANKSLVPSCLVDKTYDLYYEWRISILLNIDSPFFCIASSQTSCTSVLNGISSTDFNNNNTFVLCYGSGSKDSFIMTFMKAYRNSLAHGGFNKLLLNSIANEVYITGKGYGSGNIQLSMRLMKNKINIDNDDELFSDGINDIRFDYESVEELFEDNLLSKGYKLLEKERLENAVKYTLGNNKVKFLFIFKQNKIDDVKAYLFGEMKWREYYYEKYMNYEVILYTPYIDSAYSKDKFYSEIFDSDKENMDEYKKRVIILAKKECFLI